MSGMFRIGSKILFDGYLMIGLFLNKTALIIKYFLFDGYLTVSTSYQQFEVSAYLTGNPKQRQKQSKTIEQQAHFYLMAI